MAAVLASCGIFNPPPVPEGFTGWFHVDRPGRASNVQFVAPSATQLSDLGCDRPLIGETPWVSDSTPSIQLPQWSGAPVFKKDPTVAGALVATPGLYSSAPEQWLPGATCLVCPAGDAGVAVACSAPAVLDGGT
ncbi:MAG TPA: hypothetical protein VLQ79_00500 [Myxococcaceae bacterium]|nr:hypothetical protein [Myxococcaceae bacterium]